MGQGKGPGQGGAATAHSSCPWGISVCTLVWHQSPWAEPGGLCGSGLLTALQAAVWQLEVVKAAGAAREHLLGEQELAQGWQPRGKGLGKHLPAPSQAGRTVSAEWGEGLHEPLPLLSLALELTKEGPGQGTQQRGFPPSALRLPGLGA